MKSPAIVGKTADVAEHETANVNDETTRNSKYVNNVDQSKRVGATPSFA